MFKTRMKNASALFKIVRLYAARWKMAIGRGKWGRVRPVLDVVFILILVLVRLLLNW